MTDTKKRSTYEKPVVKTVVTPEEIRDIEQPCAFYRPGEQSPGNQDR